MQSAYKVSFCMLLKNFEVSKKRHFSFFKEKIVSYVLGI